MIQLQSVIKDWGDKRVLSNIDLIIYPGEKIGIIGSNGQGKSTLVNIISKQIALDSGTVVIDENLAVLEQSSDINFSKILENLSNNEFSNQFFIWLKLLGFNNEIELDATKISKLSSGEKTKIGLANCFAQNPTALVLDEPTNHLDISAKNLIIKQINNFQGAVIIVSHDRDFLNKTVNKIIELKDGKIKEYYGNYDEYKLQKENEKLTIKRNYEKHKKKVAHIEEDMEQYKKFAKLVDAGKHQKSAMRAGVKHDNGLRADVVSTKFSRIAASQMKKLQKELDKDVERPEKEINIKYKLQKNSINTKVAIKVENLTKKFQNQILFENANFVIESGQKVALLGDNGTGKSTFIKMILEQTDYDGFIYKTPSLKIATMFQDVYDLNGEITINQMSQLYDKEFRTNFITNIVSMNIDKSRFNTKIKFLSSGEKMRLKLAELILTDANLIILDEPTNHLDIENKQYLEKVLSGYVGTLIVVSHDLDFIKNVSNCCLVLNNKKLVKYDELVDKLYK